MITQRGEIARERQLHSGSLKTGLLSIPLTMVGSIGQSALETYANTSRSWLY